ncbi:hypothetical protein CTAYLR_000090 [Chrysophaeum taylorii]|uniref:Acyltransferase n=1 Tax=Chrysophaeum taylorii TaxID=2483200 RepID=A0AAD7UGH3_9STRA|nr:hypothetical protein CTAYLR_000090 [Chrysophaeum taylorii]
MNSADLYPCEVEASWLVPLGKQARIRIAWIYVTLFCSLFYLIPGLGLGVVLLALNGHLQAAGTLVVTLVGLSVIPMREWPEARRAGELLYELFDVRTNLKASMVDEWHEEGDRYILGMHPHGIIPLQTLLWCAFCHQYLRPGPNRSGPTMYGFGGMATVLTRLPVLRTILGWLSGRSADYKTLKKGILSGKNLYMLPGGLAEIFTAQPGHDVAVWRPRRGLCRLALETGARLVPLYVFGGNDFFDQLATSDSLIARFSRKYKMSLTLYWGYLGLPIPYQPPNGVVIAFGNPLPSRRVDHPTPADIDTLHAAYEAELQRVFDLYKKPAGRPNARLRVI